MTSIEMIFEMIFDNVEKIDVDDYRKNAVDSTLAMWKHAINHHTATVMALTSNDISNDIGDSEYTMGIVLDFATDNCSTVVRSTHLFHEHSYDALGWLSQAFEFAYSYYTNGTYERIEPTPGLTPYNDTIIAEPDRLYRVDTGLIIVNDHHLPGHQFNTYIGTSRGLEG